MPQIPDDRVTVALTTDEVIQASRANMRRLLAESIAEMARVMADRGCSNAERLRLRIAVTIEVCARLLEHM